MANSLKFVFIALIQNEDDIIPKKFALKYNPPLIALEYYLKPLSTDYLLQINLEEPFKLYDTAEEISKWIFKTYSDIINKTTISEKQVYTYISNPRWLISSRDYS